MTEKNHMSDDAQAVQVTDAMIEAGARAMAAADGWHRWQAYATMAKHCLIAAQPLSAVAQACAVRLEARPADNSKEWTEIFPAQLEWVAKEGHQVRAIELAAQPPAAPVETDADLPTTEDVRGILGPAHGGCSADSADERAPGQCLSECRDFLTDLVGGAPFEGRAVEHARELIQNAGIALAAFNEPQTVIGSATLRAAAQALVHEISESGTHTRWKRLANAIATENERTEPRTTVSETQFQAALRKICERTNDPVARSIAGEALEIAEQAQMGGTHD